MLRLTASTAAGFVMFVSSTHAQSTMQWAAAVDGDFGIAANWSPAMIPGPLDTAVLGGDTPYVVRSELSRSVAVVDVMNTQATFAIAGSRGLTIEEARGRGTILVNDVGAASVTDFLLRPGASVDPDIVLNAPEGVPISSARLRRTSSGGDAITINGDVFGRGQISGSFNFEGDIDVSSAGDFMAFSLGDLVLGSNTTVRSDVGAGISLSNITASGGTWDGGSGGLIEPIRSTLTDAAFTGTWQIRAARNLTLAGSASGTGTFVVNDDQSPGTTQILFEPGAMLEPDVVLNAGPGAPVASAQMRPVDPSGALVTLLGDISGRGNLVGGFSLQGTVSPGSPAVPTDLIAFNVLTPLVFESGSALDIEIAGTDDAQFDRLAGSGTVAVGGELDVRFIDGFGPEAADRFEIISASVVEGTFDSVRIDDVGSFGPAHVVYTSEAVIVVACAADRDGDGDLTIFDFLAFQNLFDAGDTRADLDGDGNLTIFDFLVFQNRFDEGCG